MTDHPTNGLDEVVHQRHRLGILTITAEARRAEFGYLRDALDLTPGNLSRHLTVLEEAGLVDVEKGYEGRRPRTWVRITRQGRSALGAELDLLAALVHQHTVLARRAETLQRRSQATSASKDEAPPNGDEAAPGRDGSVPAGDEAGPAVAEAALEDDEAATTGDEAPPTGDA